MVKYLSIPIAPSETIVVCSRPSHAYAEIRKQLHSHLEQYPLNLFQISGRIDLLTPEQIGNLEKKITNRYSGILVQVTSSNIQFKFNPLKPKMIILQSEQR